jgi:hypothetical protein
MLSTLADNAAKIDGLFCSSVVKIFHYERGCECIDCKNFLIFFRLISCKIPVAKITMSQELSLHFVRSS